MTSIQNRLFVFVMRYIVRPRKLIGDFARAQGDPQAFAQYAKKLRRFDQKTPKRENIAQREIDGFSLIKLLATQETADKVVLYLHGGCYICGPSAGHWTMLDQLTSLTGYDAALFDYPKTPEHHAEETLEVTQKAFDHLADKYGSDNIILMGDSAGGGLALAIAMQRAQQGQSLPSSIVLLSPWLDITMSNSEIHAYADADATLDADGLRAQGNVYRGAIDARDPRVSPMFGAVDGLPPIHIFAGTSEIFYPDCRDFYEKYKHKDVHLITGEQMQHVWLATPTPEAKKSIQQVVNIIS